MNRIIEIARNKRKEKYITPEDVTDALNKARFTTQPVQKDLLEVLGKQTDYGVEDYSLCAFVAWKGKSS